MKNFIDKFFANTSRYEMFFLAIPFILWIYCFHYFFTGSLWLEADAVSYSDHIGIYTDNLSKGIYPLWNPSWYGGAPYDFFLRRIGDVNPLLWIIVFLKWFGVSSATSYLVFITIYYFLAAFSLYLITRFLLKDPFYAFTAYILFLFSSWGMEIFYNYIIIIFVPIIWFFYFLLRFYDSPKKVYFLGMFFCAGLIVTTYIPFFFLSILAIFTFFHICFYGQNFIDFLGRALTFFTKNIIFAALCVVFLLYACLPGVIFYKESKGGEFVLPNRHLGANTASEITVGMQNVASGDIISHGYFDRLFDDQANIDMGDIYIPFVFFLVLLTSIFARSSKLIFFLLFNILALALITITSAANVHRFLYEHLFIFKFIRNIYYFFWLGMLPMGILLAAAVFKSMMEGMKDGSHKNIWRFYIIFCHLVFMAFLATRHGTLWGAWVCVGLSLAYFLIYFQCERKISYLAGFCLLLLALFIQSAQVYAGLDKKLFQIQQQTTNYVDTHQIQPKRPDLYYAAHWYDLLINYIDQETLANYTRHTFVLYDNVIPYIDSPQFLKIFGTTIAANNNIAYVSKNESSPDDWKGAVNSSLQADFDPLLSEKLSISHSDFNTWDLKAHLQRSQFLVINDAYNSDWHAFIDHHPVKLFRANVAFKGLWLPAGDSQVLVRFSTPKRYAFHFGLIVLFGAVFLYLIFLLKKEAQWRV